MILASLLYLVLLIPIHCSKTLIRYYYYYYYYYYNICLSFLLLITFIIITIISIDCHFVLIFLNDYNTSLTPVFFCFFIHFCFDCCLWLPSCTAVMVVPLAPQSTINAVALALLNAANTADFDKNTAGVPVDSNRCCTAASR